jgi:hypothetical protein
VAGPSKHFKTILLFMALAQWQQQHPAGICMFYNNEFGVNKGYMEKCGVDTERIMHIPFTTIEDAKDDIAQRINGVYNEKTRKTTGGFEVGDPVFWLMDSVGNAASASEVNKAGASKQSADMGSRAKALRSFFRVLVPMFNMKKMIFAGVGGSIDTMEEYSKRVMTGGGGPMLAADNVIMMFRKEIKDDDKANLSFAKGRIIDGYEFILLSDKSRYVKEQKTIPINVYWNTGVAKWSGFDELAVNYGIIESVNRGNKGTQLKFDPTKFGHEGEAVFANITEKIDADGVVVPAVDTDDSFWGVVFAKSNFAEMLTNDYHG